MQYVLPENLCDGTQSMDTQVLQCQNARMTCSEGDARMVNPPYSGTGSVDTGMCVKDYASVFAVACPNNFYLSLNSTKFATTLPASHKILPNADGTVFAQMSPFAGVDIFLGRSVLHL